MKKALSKNKSSFWHFDENGHQVFGVAPPDVWGNLSNVWGDLSNVTGDLSGVRGDLTGVWGDLTGVWGDLSNVWGDLDDCDLSDEDRERGIHIGDLIAPIEPKERKRT